MKKLRYVLSISLVVFIFLSLLSILFTKTLDRDFIGMGGFLFGLIFILPSIKLHRLVFFGSRANQAEWIIPDEHIQHKMNKPYEKEENEKKDTQSKMMIDILGYSGVMIIILSFFVVPL